MPDGAPRRPAHARPPQRSLRLPPTASARLAPPRPSPTRPRPSPTPARDGSRPSASAYDPLPPGARPSPTRPRSVPTRAPVELPVAPPSAPGAGPGRARPRARHRRRRTWRLTSRGRVVAATVVTIAVLAVAVVHGSSGHHPAAGASVTAGAPAARHGAASPSTPPPTVRPTTSAVVRDAAGVPILVSRAVAAAGVPLSVAVYDATTGRTWTFQDRGGQVEASVAKLSILGAVLLAEQAGARRTAGVVALERLMIGQSDNHAASELYERVGRRGVAGYDAAVGAGDVVADEDGEFGLDESTAADQVRIMRALAYPNGTLTDASRAQATALLDLVEADQHWGASGGVPAGVSVELKNGWLPHGTGWVVNTVGHVTGSGRDYVVAIMSQGSGTEEAGIDRIEKVSAAVWATAGVRS